MAELVPAISTHRARHCAPKRGHRGKPGDDRKQVARMERGVMRGGVGVPDSLRSSGLRLLRSLETSSLLIHGTRNFVFSMNRVFKSAKGVLLSKQYYCF